MVADSNCIDRPWQPFKRHWRDTWVIYEHPHVAAHIDKIHFLHLKTLKGYLRVSLHAFCHLQEE